MAYDIYTGVWINHDYNRILGATLTLTSRDGGLLLAFIAALVAVAGTRLWRMISYLLHQLLASAEPKDGVFHQRQVVLRNNASSLGTAWALLQIAWFWKKVSRHVVLKTMPLIVFALGFSILFAAATIFSSQVVKVSSPARLIKAGACGVWTGGEHDEDLTNWRRKSAADGLRATLFARSCYVASPTSADCSLLHRPNLPFNFTSNVNCPFDEEMCLNGFVHHVDSGFLDSHVHLGINAAEEDRILLRKQTTCAPLPTGERYTYYINGTEAEALGWGDDALLCYQYGPTFDGEDVNDCTFTYNTYGVNSGTTYSVHGMDSVAPRAAETNISTPWKPLPSLRRDNTSDLVIIFLAFNSVTFDHRCNDPVFSAQYEHESLGFYPDRVVSPIVCKETYTLCNTNNDCSPALGLAPLYDDILQARRFTISQSLLAQRLMMDLIWTSLFRTVQTRASNALRAQDTLYGIDQAYLPENQWEVEVQGWFADALARLQFLTTDYANQPEKYIVYGDEIQRPSETFEDGIGQPLEGMCANQLINDTQSTMSFSVVGLVIVISIGGSIIFVSLIIESLVSFIQKKAGKGLVAREAWLQDEAIKLQGTMLETAGIGSWRGHSDVIPTTENEELLDTWPLVSRSYFARRTQDEKKFLMPGEEHSMPQVIKRKPLPSSYETELYPAPPHTV